MSGISIVLRYYIVIWTTHQESMEIDNTMTPEASWVFFYPEFLEYAPSLEAMVRGGTPG